MKIRFITFMLIILSLLVAGHSIAVDLAIYKHPTLNIQFRAQGDWKQLPRSEDKLIYEVLDPEGIVHVVLWYTSTEQGGLRYLQKMADMKGLELGENDKLESLKIGSSPAWTLRLTGYEGGIPIHSILTVISYGKSPKHPKENSLFIIQIWCAEKYYEQKKKLMEDILASIEII